LGRITQSRSNKILPQKLPLLKDIAQYAFLRKHILNSNLPKEANKVPSISRSDKTQNA